MSKSRHSKKLGELSRMISNLDSWLNYGPRYRLSNIEGL